LAARDQYRHYDRHVPDGLSDSEHANRDTLALQLKLSELILAMEGADNRMADIENASDKEIEAANAAVKQKASLVSHICVLHRMAR
jgi:low affinity Fe/Cu permease